MTSHARPARKIVLQLPRQQRTAHAYTASDYFLRKKFESRDCLIAPLTGELLTAAELALAGAPRELLSVSSSVDSLSHTFSVTAAENLKICPNTNSWLPIAPSSVVYIFDLSLFTLFLLLPVGSLSFSFLSSPPEVSQGKDYNKSTRQIYLLRHWIGCSGYVSSSSAVGP